MQAHILLFLLLPSSLSASSLAGFYSRVQPLTRNERTFVHGFYKPRKRHVLSRRTTKLEPVVSAQHVYSEQSEAIVPRRSVSVHANNDTSPDSPLLPPINERFLIKKPERNAESNSASSSFRWPSALKPNLDLGYSISLFGWIVALATQTVHTPGTDAFQSLIPVLFAATTSAQDAAAKGRLGSDTYKRLNLVLLVFSILAILGHSFSPTSLVLARIPAGPVKTALRGGGTVLLFGAISAATGAIGWKAGIAENETLLSELNKARKSFLPSLKPFTLKSKAYLALMLGHIALFLSQRVEYISSMPNIASRVGAFAHHTSFEVVLLSVLFTQLDAANRGRINATTFRHLNFGLFLTSILSLKRMVAYIASPLQWFWLVVPASTAVVSLATYVQSNIQIRTESKA